jgi:hypothetical protein
MIFGQPHQRRMAPKRHQPEPAPVEQLMAQAQTALRDGRATSVRAAHAMTDSYAALAG